MTGATGFVGSNLVRQLVADGTVVCCVTRRHSPRRHRIPLPAEADVVETDSFGVSDLRAALDGRSWDVVFHLASYGVEWADEDPNEMLAGNVGLMTNLVLAAAGRVGCFIHAGSCSEYGRPASDQLLDDDHPLAPISLYGAAKAAAHIYGSALARKLGLPFFTLRLFGIFGVGEGPDRLVPYLIRRLQRDESVDLTGGEQVRDLLYVQDVVDAMIAAHDNDGLARYSAYNVCSGRPVKVKDVAEAVADALDKPRTLLKFGARPYRAAEPMWLVGDNRRFVEATGWRPRVSLQDGIRRMLDARADDLADALRSRRGV